MKVTNPNLFKRNRERGIEVDVSGNLISSSGEIKGALMPKHHSKVPSLC